jgi:hypothetical protein
MHLLWVSAAWAHIGATITGVDVEPGVDGPHMLVEANFGLLWAADGQRYEWTCHETVTAEGVVLTPRYARGADGTLLVTITAMQGRDAQHSLYRSADDGCNWTTAGMPDQLVSALDWSGPVPVLGTANLDADNDVYVSHDSGESWVAVGLDLGHRVVLAAVADDTRAWATVADVESEQVWLARSVDTGETWTLDELDLSPWASGRLQRAIVIAHHDDVVWMVAGFLDHDVVLRIDGDEVESVLQVDGDLIDGARTSEGVFAVVEGSRQIHTSADGLTWAVDPELPTSIGVGANDTLWFTAYADFTGGLLFHGPDHALVPHEIAGPLECPADSESAQICDPLWPQLDERLQVFAPWDSAEPVDTSPPVRPPEARFACSSVPGPGWLLALLTVPLLRRRRRC